MDCRNHSCISIGNLMVKDTTHLILEYCVYLFEISKDPDVCRF